MGIEDNSVQEMQQLADGTDSHCPPDMPLSEQVRALASDQIKLQQQFTTALAHSDALTLRQSREHLLVVEEDIRKLKIKLNAALLDHDIAAMNDMIFPVYDQDDASVGQKYVERASESNCRIIIAPDMGNDRDAPLATYTSYSNGETAKGFINEVAINENRLGNIFSLANGVAHEQFHAFQAMSAPALHHTPFNPGTNILVHPEDWIHLDNLCERDAYAKQAMMNYLVSQNHAGARERSELDLVSVKEFEQFRSILPTLQQAVVHASLNALYKTRVKNDLDSPCFWQHYQDEALRNYSVGMNRRGSGEGFVFVRLEPADFFAVGAYDVGPNAFGKFHIDPGFLERMPLSGENQEKINKLSKTYAIPALAKCPTLGEALHPAFAPRQEKAYTHGGLFSNAVHAPSIA